MGRVVHVRLYGPATLAPSELVPSFNELVDGREWRSAVPALAHAASKDLFSMEFFRHALLAESITGSERWPLVAASFVRLQRDETDALAILFVLRSLSEQFGIVARLHDPDNPIAKLRLVTLTAGRLPGGAALETILVARPIFKRLPGAVIELLSAPAQQRSAGGTLADIPHRAWAFRIHGMCGSAAGFFEAEAEAMRMYRGLRFLAP